MILSFHPCFVADFQVILGDRSPGPDESAMIREADAIILPQGCTEGLYRACRGSQAGVFPNYDLRYAYCGKAGQHLLFKETGCLCPETAAWPDVATFQKTMTEKGACPHDLPFVVKVNNSHEGAGVFFVTDGPTLEGALDKVALRERCGFAGFVTQEWVPAGGNVLRVVVMGRAFLSYWKRPERADQVVTTIGRGAIIDKIWREDLQQKGREAARDFSLTTGINLAAIDFVFNLAEPDPAPLFLEVNYYFGRRGLGGSRNYYRFLYSAVQEWLIAGGFDPSAVTLY